MTHPIAGTPDAAAAAAGSAADPADWNAHPVIDAPQWMTPLAPPSSLATQQEQYGAQLWQGLKDLPEGAAQLAAHTATALLPDNATAKKAQDWLDSTIEGQEKAYAKTFPGGQEPSVDIPRAAGSMLLSAPLAYLMPGVEAESLGGRMLSGAASGAATGAAQPVDVSSQNYWNAKGTQAASGAAGGAVGPVVTGAAARLISPNVNSDVKLLMNEGITPTPGQITGGWFKDLEDKFTSIPGLGDAIKSAKLRAMQDLDRAAINRSLAPIGEALGKNTPVGREAIQEAGDKFDNAYDTLLPKMNWQADPQFVQGVTSVAQNANLAPDKAAQFAGFVKNQFSKIPASGAIPGPDYKNIESAFKQQASDYLNSPNPDDRALGSALRQVQLQMRSALQRANPQYAPQLSAIDNGYADFLRVQGAAAYQGSKGGVFGPTQLSASVKALDPSLRDKAFARGQARMQDLSDAAKSVLGSDVPDSGTAGRGLAAAGLLSLVGGGGEMAHLPMSYIAPAIATGTGGMAAYSRPGQSMLATLLARRPAIAAPIASGVRTATPFATTGLASVLARTAAAP